MPPWTLDPGAAGAADTFGTTMLLLRASAFAAVVAVAASHGSLVTPRPRNSIDFRVGVNTEHCSNATGDKCENGQAAFYYSQGW